MNREWNDDLRRRQRRGDVGFLGRPGQRRLRGRALLLWPVLLLIGIALVYVGPVPGLGLLLIIGSVFGFLATYVSRWLGG